MNNFKVTSTATSLRITAVETGSVVAIKHTPDGFVREKVMENETDMLESSKERSNAGYLSLFIAGFTGNLGKEETTVADKIKIMAEAIRQFGDVTTYRTLNNKLRQHFDDEQVLPHKAFRKQFFYEGSWRYTHLKKKATTAVKKATKPLPIATAKPKAATKPATKPATKKAAKKSQVPEQAVEPVLDAEEIISLTAPEAIVELEIA